MDKTATARMMMVAVVLLAAGVAASPTILCLNDGNMPACLMKIQVCMGGDLFEQTQEELDILKGCCVRLHRVEEHCDVMIDAVETGRRDLVNPFLRRMMPMIHMCTMDKHGMLTDAATLNATAYRIYWQDKMMNNHDMKDDKMQEEEMTTEQIQEILMTESPMNAEGMESLEDDQVNEMDQDDQVNEMDQEKGLNVNEEEVEETGSGNVKVYKMLFKMIDNDMKMKAKRLLWGATETCALNNLRHAMMFPWCMLKTCITNM